MANGSIITNSGKKLIMNRIYKASPDYTIPSSFKIGISNGTPLVGDTDLDVSVPIANGTTNDDGDNQFTGSNGGDNTTDNTTVFKQGAGNSDGKGQNLLTTGSNVTKTWTIADLTANGAAMTATEPFGCWLYLDETAAYDNLEASSTAVQVKFRTNGDGATLFYTKTWTKADLAAGWNWLTSGTTAVNGLTQGGGGAPSGALNEFIIEITTDDAGDQFAAGECVYDLLRQWSVANLSQTFTSGFPTFDETNHEVTIRGTLSSTQANGFDLNGFGLVNTDGTVLLHSEDTFTAESKSDTDQFTFIVVDRLI